jgi:hypothetical protein
MRRFAALVIGVLAALSPAMAGAQTTGQVPVAGLLPTLIADGSILTPGSLGNQSDHFVGAFRAIPAVAALNRTLALEVGGFPLGPTGTIVVTNQDGVDNRPKFASGYSDGAATLGRGRRSLAVSYQDTTFESVDGLNLRASDINLFVQNRCCTGTPSDRDVLQETVSLRLHRRVTAFALGYGVNDRFDIGIVVPFVQVVGDARVEANVLRAVGSDPTIHEFNPIGLGNQTIPGGTLLIANGTAVPFTGVDNTGNSAKKGIGDVIVRGKLMLLRGGAQHLAVGLDVLAPTGDADNFMGIGATQVTPALMWSLESRRVGARAKVGYTQSFGNLSSLLVAPGIDRKVPNELGYELGLDLVATSRVTLVADAIARRIPGVTGFTTGNTLYSPSTTGPVSSPDLVAANTSNLQETSARAINMVLGSAGTRVYLGGGVYADLRVLFPGAGAGLRMRPTGVFTLDYGI